MKPDIRVGINQTEAASPQEVLAATYGNLGELLAILAVLSPTFQKEDVADIRGLVMARFARLSQLIAAQEIPLEEAVKLVQQLTTQIVEDMNVAMAVKKQAEESPTPETNAGKIGKSVLALIRLNNSPDPEIQKSKPLIPRPTDAVWDSQFINSIVLSADRKIITDGLAPGQEPIEETDQAYLERKITELIVNGPWIKFQDLLGLIKEK